MENDLFEMAAFYGGSLLSIPDLAEIAATKIEDTNVV